MSDSGPILHLPPGARYDCLKCGHGCGDHWEIEIDPASEQRLAAMDLQGALAEGSPDSPFKASEIIDGRRVIEQRHGHCVFLTPDCKCGLHAKHGSESKPQRCIDFPFSAVRAGDGIFVGLSFACTAVLQNEGAPVEERRESLGQGIAASLQVRDAGGLFTLARGSEINFTDYLEIEAGLDEILGLQNVPVGQRLLAQSMYLDMIVRALEAARTEGGATAGATPATIVKRMNERFRGDRWGRLLLLTLKLKPSPALQRALLGLVTAVRPNYLEPTNGLYAACRVGFGYLRHLSKFGKVNLVPYDAPMEYDRFAAIKCERSPGSYFDSLLTRYFRHALFRKDLLQTGGILSRHKFMMMHYALLNWYVVAQTILGHRMVADAHDIREALRNVEKYYVQQKDFTMIVEQTPYLGSAMASIMGSSRFAASMVGPTVLD